MQNSTSSNYQYPMPSPDNPLMSLQTRYNTNTNSASLPSTNPVHNNNNNSNNNNNNNGAPALNGVQATATSVINLSNSSDVVIGPMTQYMGAVTIYQYMDATVDSTRHGNGPNILSGRRDDAAGCLICGYAIPNWLLVILLLLITISLSLGVFVVLQNKNAKTPREPRDILLGNNYEDPTMENLGDGHLLVKRQQWGSANITLTEKLQHPVPYVMITHVGFQSETCEDYYRCSVSMRGVQDSAIAEKLIPDVPANFYVGGNGFLFTGRGWDYCNSYNNISLAIAFIGDYVRFLPTEKQFEGVRYLINYGIAQKYIMADYQLVAHNQTKKTGSPGANVYREIIKWPHWNPCGSKGYELCGVEYGAENHWDLNL